MPWNTRSRAAAAVAALAATVTLLTGCVNVKAEWDQMVNNPAGTPAPSVVRPALLAADPRVEEVLHLQVNPDGFARTMDVRLSLMGLDPVSDETLLAVLTAAASSAQSEITGIALELRATSGEPFNLEAAAAGLPEDVTYRWTFPALIVLDPELLDSRRSG